MANDGPIRLVTYTGSTVTPLDDAVVYDAAIGTSGVMHGCDVEQLNATQIRISPGHGVIRGRKFTVQDTTLDIVPGTSATAQQGNVLIVLNLSGGDVDPIYFEAHTPREEPTPESERDITNPNYDSTVVWKLELCTYQADSTGLTAAPVKTSPTVNRVTRIKNQKTNTFHSGELTLTKDWVGLDNVANTEPAKLDVRSATYLTNPMEINFTGAFTGTAKFDGLNHKNPNSNETVKNPLEVKTKFTYNPSFAYLNHELKAVGNKKINAYMYRAGGIVIIQFNVDALTGQEWNTLASATPKIFINPTNRDMKKWLPHRMMRFTVPLINSSVSTTHWVRVSVSKEGMLSFATNAPKDQITRRLFTVLTWIPDDCDSNSGWVWNS